MVVDIVVVAVVVVGFSKNESKHRHKGKNPSIIHHINTLHWLRNESLNIAVTLIDAADFLHTELAKP